ncbi:pilus assembly FimT family protein [Defluviitalea phaphyphila]|uniref:pilus assembly FimT family protein n=1 Tax=Defluviitalea phaphyphila TaxID=1473580 RepID=UPI00072FD27C|nr:prepilin-type N-terminal cleavage/methylation domain-containing protein [Defluviitalea phaphyphila]
MGKYIKNQKGITITEILIVLAVIGIAGAIIMPSFGIVHRHRLKNISSQLSMDIQKVRFFAQTHFNTKDEKGGYKYKIIFENEENIDGEIYYKNYQIEPEDIFKNTNSIGDDIVKIRPVVKYEDGDKLIKEIQFDNRGRIQIVLAEDGTIIDFSELIIEGEHQKEKINIMLQADDKFKKEVTVNALTGKIFIID